jgi:hypothetical protein
MPVRIRGLVNSPLNSSNISLASNSAFRTHLFRWSVPFSTPQLLIALELLYQREAMVADDMKRREEEVIQKQLCIIRRPL